MTSKRVHGTSVALEDHGVLIVGHSGSGKSDLALRLIDSGGTLISDDQTVCLKKQNEIFLYSIKEIYGLLEVKGMGIIKVPYVENVKMKIIVSLIKKKPERINPKNKKKILGLNFPYLELDPNEISAVAKIKLKLNEEFSA
tara:strand:- start:751 stop:1173 length:423 start_codon:yes stop_codon:yes gene_type:complete